MLSFDRALKAYLAVAESPRSPHRKDAIYQAAILLGYNHDYQRSARMFLRYAQVEEDSAKAARARFRAWRVFEKAGDVDAMERNLDAVSRSCHSIPDRGRCTVEVLLRIGSAAERRDRWKTAQKYYARAVAEYRRRGLAPGSDAAEHAAHAAFRLAEHKLQAFLSTEIKGTILALTGMKKRLQKQAIALRNEYEQIWSYRRAGWTLASLYRLGNIYEDFARSVDEGFRNAPIPPQVERLGAGAIDVYRKKVDEALVEVVDPITAEALGQYVECVERARQTGIANELTDAAARRLNAFDPVTWPLRRPAKLAYVRPPSVGAPGETIRRAVSELAKAPGDQVAMSRMAWAYLQLDKPELAGIICDRALSREACNAGCLSLKGLIAAERGGDAPSEALRYFKRAMQCQPRSGPAWVNLGAVLLKAKRYPAALEALEKALQFLPENPEALLNLGSAYRGVGKIVKARERYARALRLRPRWPLAHFNLGVLFLDARSFPGMDRPKMVRTAISHLERYKRLAAPLSKQDPVLDYLHDASRELERRQSRIRMAAERVRLQKTIASALGSSVEDKIRALEHQEAEVRRAAAEALAKAGPAAARAVPALAKRLKDDGGGVREAAIEALGQIGTKAAAAIPELVAALQHADVPTRTALVTALGKIGQRSAKPVPSLVHALGDSDPAVRNAAISALGEIGPKAAPAIPDLVRLVKGPDPQVAMAAASTLCRLGRRGIQAVGKAARSPDVRTRVTVITALGELGSGAKAVTPLLVRAVGDPDPRVRSAGASALGKIGRPATIRTLERALRDPHVSVRLAAARALGKTSVLSAPAIRSLTVALKDRDQWVRKAAAEALGRAGPGAKDAASALSAAVIDESTFVQVAAASALGKMGQDAASAVPALETHYATRPFGTRRAIVKALAQMGPGAAAALERLLKKEQDEDIKKLIRAVCPKPD